MSTGGVEAEELIGDYVRNFRFKEHIDDVFIFANFQGSDTFIGLDFSASLGGEVVFFKQGHLLSATRDKHGRCFKIINRHGCSGCSPTFTTPTRH